MIDVYLEPTTGHLFDERGNTYRIMPAPGRVMTSTGGIVEEPGNPALDRAVSCIVEALRRGRYVFTAGNGGSDAHAGHLAAELVGRFAYDRQPLRAFHLVTGGPIGSCLANDYGYERVFSRQVAAWCTEGDVLVVFTTSGKSPNVLNAVRAASEIGVVCVALTGPNGLDAYDWTSGSVEVRSAGGTAEVQESHQRQIHEIARRVEEALCPR